MDSDEALRLLRGGRDGIREWNRWRHESKEIPELSGADLEGADLSSAELRGARLHGARLRGAVLRMAILFEADLSEADLSEAVLSGAVLNNADLHGVSLRKADLRGVSFRGVNLRGADLRGADITKARLDEADLERANLSGADLSGSILRKVNLSGAHLSGADLSRADLCEAGLVRISLHGVSLRGADLRRAYLSGAHLSGARLDGADLRDTDLRDIAGLVHGPLSVLQGLFPFYRPPFVLDANMIAGTRFPPYVRDPWSALRRTYTGPKLAFLLLFSVMAFLPLAMRAAFWITLGRLEQRSIAVAVAALERTTDLLRKAEDPARDLAGFIARSEAIVARLRSSVERDDLAIPDGLLWDISELLGHGRQLLEALERGGRLKGASRELSQAKEWTEKGAQLVRLLAPNGTVQVRRRQVWYLLLGFDQGPWPAVLSAALLLYNLARALLTYCIGPLRDEEERTGNSPAWADYRLWWRVHQVSALLLVVATISGLYQIATALTAPVLIPVGG